MTPAELAALLIRAAVKLKSAGMVLDKDPSENFNDLAKAVNSLATQSSELAKSFKNNSVIKYP